MSRLIFMFCSAEGEQEEAWLMEAGLATLFDESASGGEDSIVLLSTLTRTQAAAVERRVETLKQTLRKRNKPYSVPDVREIFKPSPDSQSKVSHHKMPHINAVPSPNTAGHVCMNDHPSRAKMFEHVHYSFSVI